MKDGLRFVDCDMHVMEPPDLFDRYLDARFKDRVILPVGKDGRPRRGTIVIDGLPTTRDAELQQYRKRARPTSTHSTQPLSGSRLADTGRLDFAVERDYDPVAQVMAMGLEGVDIAVLFPTTGLSLLARDNLDPRLSLALCEAYNNWIADFCRHSPDQLKFAAMLPVHDVHLACRELLRCVRDLGAVGSFVRPDLVNGHYWHSNYWDPLYTLHEDLDVTWGFHEGTGAWYSHMNTLYGENRFYRHVASHWIEMQQALIAMIIGGVFEFHPRLRVDVLAQAPQQRAGLRVQRRVVHPAARAGRVDLRHEDVLGHRGIRAQRDFLVDQPDAQPHRVGRPLHVDRVAAQEDRAFVRRMDAVDDLHQRRLARPVLADECDDLAAVDGEVDVGQRDHGRKAFGDSRHLQ